MQAKALFKTGKRAGVAQLLQESAIRFVKFYFPRLGFLDGVPGLVGYCNGFPKYAKLMALQNNRD